MKASKSISVCSECVSMWWAPFPHLEPVNILLSFYYPAVGPQLDQSFSLSQLLWASWAYFVLYRYKRTMVLWTSRKIAPMSKLQLPEMLAVTFNHRQSFGTLLCHKRFRLQLSSSSGESSDATLHIWLQASEQRILFQAGLAEVSVSLLPSD